MSEALPAIAALESAGVDYLTATQRLTGVGRAFRDLGDYFIEQSASSGNDVARFAASEYRGWRSGGVCVGTRHDGHIIRLSSHDAVDHWREVMKQAANVSRIDLQLTFTLERQYEAYIREQHASALRAKQGRGRRREIELKWNNVKGDTLYLGNRTSDVSARVYDKGRQEKSDPAGVRIRQELEYKRERALAVALNLHNSDSETISIHNLVSTYVSRFDLQTVSNYEEQTQCARGRTTSNDKRRRWLRAAVSPSVRRLLDAGMLSEVLTDLGLADYVTMKPDVE